MDAAAAKLESLARGLRTEVRDDIHLCERLMYGPDPERLGADLWSETRWQSVRDAAEWLNEYLLPSYTLLSFGALPERTRSILADQEVRFVIATAIRGAGHVPTDDGEWVEVLQ